MNIVSHQFRFHPLFRLPAAVVGVRPSNAAVVVEDDRLVVRFGRWTVETPLSNVVSARVTGPYAWPKVIGPPHLSLADRGLTFATNPDEGVCICFAEPVRGIDPLGRIRHPGLTVTVDEPAALAELLDRAAHDAARTHTDSGDVTAEDLLEEVSTELRSLSAAELRRRARDRGVKGASRMSKSDLVDLLTS